MVNKGFKVAICEQVEEPSQAKGIVKRDVIKVITPGTYSETTGDEEYKNTYIMAIYNSDGYYGIASSDISTGEFKTTFFKELKTTLLDEVSKILPKEVIVDTNFNEDIIAEIHNISNALITKKNIQEFNCTDEELINQFTEAQIAGLDSRSKAASSILLKYILDDNITDINWSRELWINHLEKGRYKVNNFKLDDIFIKQFYTRISNLMNVQFNQNNPLLEAETENNDLSTVD